MLYIIIFLSFILNCLNLDTWTHHYHNFQSLKSVLGSNSLQKVHEFKVNIQTWGRTLTWGLLMKSSFALKLFGPLIWLNSLYIYIYDYTVLSMSIELFLRKFVFLYIFMSEVNPPFLWYQPPKNLQLYCLL